MFKVMYYLFFSLLLFFCAEASAQNRFICTSQVFAIINDSNEFGELTITEGNNSVRYAIIKEDLGVNLNAIGFRSSDRYIYGIREGSTLLIRIDNAGNTSEITSLDIDPELFYLAGDFSIDGRYFVLIGRSQDLNDQQVYFIDMLSNYDVSILNLNGLTTIEDIAQDPLTEHWYGYDSSSRNVLFLDPSGNTIVGLSILEAKDALESVFFDAFGNLFGVGSTAFGIAHALFRINKETGELDLITTGPQTFLKDMTACPYTVDISLTTNSRFILPCTNVEYEIDIINQTLSTVPDLTLSVSFPQGIEYQQLNSNTLSEAASYNSNSRQLSVNGFDMQTGLRFLRFNVEVGNLEEMEISLHAQILGLPSNLGSNRLSDDPKTDAFDDPSILIIVRPVEDSLIENRLLCYESTIILDASPYGNGLVWNNGSEDSQLAVDETGLYYLTSDNSCIDIYVAFNVTEAFCPYTIQILHTADPPEFFPCSQVVLRYVLDNNSGFDHGQLTFSTELNEVFTFLDVLKMPLGSELKLSEDGVTLSIHNLMMRAGLDSIELLVEVGDVVPQVFNSRAFIDGFPNVLGPNRFSDDPNSILLDSTRMEVLGTLSDSVFVEATVCFGDTLILDGSAFGVNHLWEDGSVDSIFNVTQQGVYQLSVFDGCHPSEVFFNVSYAKDINIQIPEPYYIYLGDSIYLEMELENEGDSLSYYWKGEDMSQFICNDCYTAIAFPYFDKTYLFVAENEECIDSVEVNVIVDRTRKVYYPNVFSPNADGFNDNFIPQSSKFGFIQKFEIFDRWGNRVYTSQPFFFSDEVRGWDGFFQGNPAPNGVYIWVSEIEFLDGLIERFSGDVTIIR